MKAVVFNSRNDSVETALLKESQNKSLSQLLASSVPAEQPGPKQFFGPDSSDTEIEFWKPTI